MFTLHCSLQYSFIFHFLQRYFISRIKGGTLTLSAIGQLVLAYGAGLIPNEVFFLITVSMAFEAIKFHLIFKCLHTFIYFPSSFIHTGE
jgi:hypothetical protein